MFNVRFRWHWARARTRTHVFACAKLSMFNDNAHSARTTRCDRVYVGVNAHVVATLTCAQISVTIDNSSNVLALFDSEAATSARVSVGVSSSLVANFNVGAQSRIELLADRTASVDIAFVNVLFESSVETLLKLRARSRALVYVSAVVANQAFVNTISALALGKHVKLKLVFDVLLAAAAPILISPRFAARDMSSLLVHAVSVNSLRSNCVYWSNRLIGANALAALSLYSLCITRFG
ncbi:hypothetical protein TETAUR1a_000041 [Candidatus Hodgkinia cicadicola]|nr:hypothetical protein TETAUR1a_000041 [Candidatus Hodgkinia cicadicola]